MIELEVVGGVARGKRIRTNVPFLSVGRATEHTIVIDDPFVSRHHGEILLIDSGYQYRDLNSTHGTILHRQGEQDFIRQVILRAGDELSFGGQENLLRILKLEAIGADMDAGGPDDPSITRMHIQADRFVPPEDLYANDSNALRAIVAFDSRIMESNLTTERQLFRALLEQMPLLFERMIYAAIVEKREGGAPQLFDFELSDATTKVRLSSTVLSLADEVSGGIVYSIDRDEEVVSGERQRILSRQSQIGSRSDESRKLGRTGICVPVHSSDKSVERYLQIERSKLYGDFRPRDVALGYSLLMRVEDRFRNIELVQQNQRLNHSASLGLFAGMIGHDIKNYLFYSKKLSDIKDDRLGQHPAIAKGIERARKLAQSMKELAAPGKSVVKTFSCSEIVRSMVDEFNSLFGEECRFEHRIADDVGDATTNEDLLSRVIWNLVMNAYHASENRPRTMTGMPAVKVRADRAGDRIRLRVEDNAGGIGPQTFEYITRSFDLIRHVYVRQEDLIDVVNEISAMRGFTNSIGLFFTAVATNDMHGTIDVETQAGTGSVFTVTIPAKIEELKNLLLF